MAVNSLPASLAHTPLSELVARLVSLVHAMSLDDVAALVGVVSSSASPARAARLEGASPLDAIAQAILALPSGRQRMRDVERAVVVHALARTKGNVSAAARLLGTDRKALERRIERHRIAVQRPAFG